MAVECELCPRFCVIEPGERGDCRVRINIDDKLTTVIYGYPCAMHIDPIEKKPLFHFIPGSKIFSIATVGCNLHCRNCQNWEISQQEPENSTAYRVPPERLIKLAKQYHCSSIAYTYTDPVIFYEYSCDSAKLAKAANIKNVLVTAGYINPKPWKKMLKNTDATNIDLKGITNDFYEKVCSATLAPVQKSLVMAKDAGVLLEVTHLIIPTLNDKPKDTRKLCQWIKKNLGKETPVHFSRFFPRYKMRNLPPTSATTLNRAYEIAKAEGLEYVYVGNILSKKGQNTYCPQCDTLLVERSGYKILKNIIGNGKCPKCKKEIYGVWQ
jgi:pyruvate formate lyase activating enzyme